MEEPVALTSDVKQRKQRSQDPNTNNSHKTEENFTASYTKVSAISE